MFTFVENIPVEDRFLEDCSLLAQTFEYREMNFQCHVLCTHSPLESAHGQSQWQFCTQRENTFSEFDPSKGHRVHKITHIVIPLSLCKYTLLSQK